MRFLSIVSCLLLALVPVAHADGPAATTAEACPVQAQHLAATRVSLEREHARLQAEAAAIAATAARLKAQGDELEADSLTLQQEQLQIVAAGHALDAQPSAAEPRPYENEIAGASRSRKIADYDRQARSFNQRHDAHNARVAEYNQALSRP